MQYMISTKTIAIALIGCMLMGPGPQVALAQSGQKIEPDHDLDLFQERQSRSGNTLFPGDHFSRAFPGDMWTPRQQAMLERQGIRTIGDFVAADAAAVARITGAPQRSVMSWQREIRGQLR